MQGQESQNNLKEIFDSFDADKNGTIQLSQLGVVAEKLGQPLTQKQLKDVVHHLDTDGDGKISFQQFQYWWEKGKKGKLAEIVYLKARTMKMTKWIQSQFEKAGVNLQNHKGSLKPDKVDIQVSYGQKSQNGVCFDMCTYVKGQKYKTMLETVKKYMPDIDEQKITFIVKLPSNNPTQAKAEFDSLLEQMFAESPMPMETVCSFKTIATEQELLILLSNNQDFKPILDQILMPLNQILSKLGQQFFSTSDINLTINASIDQILQDKIIQNIAKGFCLKVYSQSNLSTLAKMRKLALNKMQPNDPISRLLYLIRSSKFRFKMRTPEQLDKFCQKLGIKDVVEDAPILKDLLEQISPVIQEQKQYNPLIPMLQRITRFALKNIENNVEFYTVLRNISVNHLKVSAKNVTKFHQILFNEN